MEISFSNLLPSLLQNPTVGQHFIDADLFELWLTSLSVDILTDVLVVGVALLPAHTAALVGHPTALVHHPALSPSRGSSWVLGFSSSSHHQQALDLGQQTVSRAPRGLQPTSNIKSNFRIVRPNQRLVGKELMNKKCADGLLSCVKT